MVGDNHVRRLRAPRTSPSAQSALHRPFRVLSLTGGGYRGLFTADTLVDLCDRAGCAGRLDHTFDVFGGTSIGGLMACALSVGIAPSSLRYPL
jgi:patatin-like phospholipase/acyl hydrolase